MNLRSAGAEDAELVAHLIAEANRDVAQKFGLSAANCPRHPSLCTAAWVLADLARGERYFIAEQDAQAVGCVAYESPQPGLAYLNRLSVLPAWRRRGVGAALVRHIVELARAASIATISIGVIGAHEQLQRWYRALGFVDGPVRHFEHLPFAVKYMTLTLDPAAAPVAADEAQRPHGRGD